MVRHLVSMGDVQQDLGEVLDLAVEYKTESRDYDEVLRDRTLAMIFEKPSTRTRVSFEVAMNKMGGQALFLSPTDLQMGRGETIEDTALVLSRYVDAMMYRAHDHANVEELARHARVPVVNGLSDREHPAQVLADLLTVREAFDALEGVTYAWVGDGNNVCHSTLLGCAIAGVELRVATPEGFGPDPEVVGLAEELGGQPILTHDPGKAVEGADVVATDTWISMGEEDEKADKLEAFEGFTVDADLMARASEDAIFLHCLPAYYGNEVTKEVAHGPQSRILDQAENRMWAQMALLATLVHAA